jgi:type IV secretion system protein TrbJ
MRKNFLLFSFFAFVTSAYAQWTVFDPSNFARNTVTAIQAVQTTSTLINQYQTQLNQYQNQIMQLKNIDPAAASAMLAKNSIEQQNARNASVSMSNLYGSLGSVQSSFTNRLDTAKAMGMTWEQYTNFEQSRIKRNQDGAAARAQEDIRMLDRVERDYQFAQESEAKIPATAGTHEAMQLMNVQMNRVITQNADLIKALNSSTNGSASANAQSDKAIAEQMDLEKRKRNVRVNTDRFNGERDLANQLGNGYFAK